MRDLKEEEESLIEDEEEIEIILEEANRWGLRIEVEELARQEMNRNPHLSRLEAYVMAYNEWIK